MTIRTDFTVDWESSPRIITVAAPSTGATIQDIYDTCSYMQSQPNAMDDKILIEAGGGEKLDDVTVVGTTATLQNALIAFEARLGPDYVPCNIAGGNLVAITDQVVNGKPVYFKTPISPTAFTQLVITASSSATNSSIAAIEYSSFNGGITYDALNGHAGTDYFESYAIGTPPAPSNNIYDTRTIADKRGINVGYVIGILSFPTYEEDGETPFELSGFKFIGSGKDRTDITLEEESLIYDCTYENCYITGYLDGYNTLSGCLVGSLFYLKGYIEECILTGETIVLGGLDTAHLINCLSGLETPTIDMGGAGQALEILGHDGPVKLINKNGSESVSVSLNPGTLILDMATVTNGTITVTGNGSLVDALTGYVISTGTYGNLTIVNKLVCNECIADAVWSYRRA